MGYKINIETSTGVNAQYAKLATYTSTCTNDKQIIQATFQIYSTKEKRDKNYTPFSDLIEFRFELEKDYEGIVIEEIYKQAKTLEIFKNAEVL